MGLEMQLLRRTALRYGLKESEKDIFRKSWTLKKRADEVSENFAEALAREVLDAFARLADTVLGRGVSTRRGHRYIERRPTAGARYVVFSDHHWAFSGHRQNFFGQSGNRELYREVLQRYFDAQYTLIENGDVEELIVFEPTLAEVERRQNMTWPELDERRHVTRRDQLQRIVDDPNNQPLYGTIARFHDSARYIRVAGNHDYDLQDDDFLSVLRTRLRSIAPPADYVLLETAGADSPRVDWVIAHGHQFDTSTNPVFARRLGEVLSETLSWAYQGADRVWRWNDDVRAWAFGLDGFWNNLVTDDYVAQQIREPKRTLLLGAAFAGALTGNLHSRDGWENLFKHNIAWEYFEHSDPQRAVDREVQTGDEFFKFRHLDEVLIYQQMMRLFSDDTRPMLVLGHSHEPRFRPATPRLKGADRSPFPNYFNTGAAGRYENLIWGLEIVDGNPQIVSWSRQEPRAGAPMRRTWRPVSHGVKGSSIQATSRPVSL